MMKAVNIRIVNAFTRGGEGGSPTAVVADASGLDQQQMLSIAGRLDVSHTAYIFPTAADEISIRFFTAEKEILNCGHGTIAAHVVRLQDDPAIPLRFRQLTGDAIQFIEITQVQSTPLVHLLQQPIKITAVSTRCRGELREALGIHAARLDQALPVVLASPGTNRFLVALDSLDAVHQLRPTMAALKRVCDAAGAMGCFVYHLDKTADRLNAHARMFAPSIGVDEDIINGNSSGCLGAYLLQQQGLARVSLDVIQGHKSNSTGVVHVEAWKENGNLNAIISGSGKIVRSLDIEIG